MMMINNEEMKETESEYYTAELEPLPESPKIKNKGNNLHSVFIVYETH